VFLTCYYYVRRLDGAQQAENELLTQVGPGTAMGAVMRRYWIPVLLREEVPDPDGDPVNGEGLGSRSRFARNAG
jgi:hypothetical protein